MYFFITSKIDSTPASKIIHKAPGTCVDRDP